MSTSNQEHCLPGSDGESLLVRWAGPTEYLSGLVELAMFRPYAETQRTRNLTYTSARCLQPCSLNIACLVYFLLLPFSCIFVRLASCENGKEIPKGASSLTSNFQQP